MTFSPSGHADDIELTCGGTRSFSRIEATPRHRRFDSRRWARAGPRRFARAKPRGLRNIGRRFRETLDFGDGGLRVNRETELTLIDLIGASGRG